VKEVEWKCTSLSDVILALECIFVKGCKEMLITKKQDNTFTIKAKH